MVTRIFAGGLRDGKTSKTGLSKTIRPGKLGRSSAAPLHKIADAMQLLEFAECYGYWARSGADCWGETADDTHDEGEDDSAEQQA